MSTIVRLPGGTFWDAGPRSRDRKPVLPKAALERRLESAMRDVGAPAMAFDRTPSGHLRKGAERVNWRIKIWGYMRYQMKMTYPEIGAASGCSHTTVLDALKAGAP